MSSKVINTINFLSFIIGNLRKYIVDRNISPEVCRSITTAWPRGQPECKGWPRCPSPESSRASRLLTCPSAPHPGNSGLWWFWRDILWEGWHKNQAYASLQHEHNNKPKTNNRAVFSLQASSVISYSGQYWMVGEHSGLIWSRTRK